MQRIDLTGKYFGYWKVIRHLPFVKGKQAKVLCQCECGVEREIQSQSLRNGMTRSCGCKKGDMLSGIHEKHGHAVRMTKTYQAWQSMKARCNRRKKNSTYTIRGINVCDRWKNSFENFLLDMGECPDGMSLDRIRGFGDYEPGNCRWATYQEQAINREIKDMLEPRYRDYRGRLI
jgi:hypothetical protein